MKNKNGFTLIELIAVIGILAIILMIAVPSVLNARNNALSGLSKEQEGNLKDAGKLLGIDLDDYGSLIFNCKTGSWVVNSGDAVECIKNDSGWESVHLTVDKLIEKGYFKDEGNHCSGGLTVIKIDSGYRVTFDADLNCNGGH